MNITLLVAFTAFKYLLIEYVFSTLKNFKSDFTEVSNENVYANMSLMLRYYNIILSAKIFQID